jgi:peptide deformylase
MVQTIIQYPTPLSVEYATDVRVFDEKLFALIDDLKDTINENNLDGLAAYQIGNYHNVIVLKKDDDFLEIINPRLIGHSGTLESEEKTAYYPNKSALIKRFESVSIVYQDRNGKDKTLRASGKLAVLLQRKIDYTFGATFIHKMSKNEKERFEASLSSTGKSLKESQTQPEGEYCPRTFSRDKILLFANIVTAGMFILLLASFFMDAIETLWKVELYGAFTVVLLDILYFFYAQYEGKKYISCDSCQLGNIIGTVAISLGKLSVVMALAYYFLGSA